MLCRRCGMDSSTTDICEWCRKPMLPAGEPPRGREPAGGKTKSQPAVMPEQEAPASPVPVVMDGGPDVEVAEEAEPLPPPGEVLLPLGGPAAAASKPGVPSHGLSADATRTSVDIANYLGPDQSLFRPMVRTEHTATMDPLAQQRTRKQMKAVSDVPDNTRLLRSLITGLVICLPLAIVEFMVTQKVPDKLFIVPLVRGGDSLGAALVWGIASGVFLGGGMGALLVQWKKGSFVGLLIGLVLGYFGLGTEPVYYGILAAVLTGIVVGRHATYGYRRAVQV